MNLGKMIAVAIAGTFLASEGYGQQATGPSGVPPHYKPADGGCRPDRGYSFIAETPTHRSTYPKLILRVFNGEVIGAIFEVPAASGWKPWYDQPEGKPTSHGSGPAHYSQAIYFKKPPTAQECALSPGPWGHKHSK